MRRERLRFCAQPAGSRTFFAGTSGFRHYHSIRDRLTEHGGGDGRFGPPLAETDLVKHAEDQFNDVAARAHVSGSTVDRQSHGQRGAELSRLLPAEFRIGFSAGARTVGQTLDRFTGPDVSPTWRVPV
jgi:hypothetical protein